MARRGHVNVVLALLATIAMGKVVVWFITPEAMDVNEDGAYTLGMRVPMSPVVRVLNAATNGGPPRWLLQRFFPLDLESTKKRAKAMTGGLDDYGEFFDMDAFSMILSNVDERVNFVGRMTWYQKAPAVLAVHLRITQILRDHPEVRKEHIEQPIIIAGYVRSGSTWLQHTMAQTFGDSLRFVTFWESLGAGIDVNPLGPSTTRKLGQAMMEHMHHFPSIFAMHEVQDINQPEEEVGWTDLASRGFLAVAQNEHPHLDFLAIQPSSARLRYRLLKALMQIKQWQEGPQRWILKSPEHLLGIQELADTFPDAKVVTIHRDEVAVFKSLLYLFHTTRNMVFSEVNVEKTKIATDIQLCAQRRGLAATTTTDIDSLALHFHDVIGQPLNTLKQVAEFTGLHWNATIETRAQVAIEAAARRKKEMGGKIVYQIDAFGLTEAGIRERLGKCEQYDIFTEPSTSTSTTTTVTTTERELFCMKLLRPETHGTATTLNQSNLTMSQIIMHCQKFNEAQTQFF
jgi:hypothetical protein